jgi:hypothetical protein
MKKILTITKKIAVIFVMRKLGMLVLSETKLQCSGEYEISVVTRKQFEMASTSLICKRYILWKARFTCVHSPHFNCYAIRAALGDGSPSSASCPYPSPTSATTSSPRIDTELGGDRQSFLIKSKRYDQRKTCTSPLNDLRCFCLPVVISNVSR